MRASSMGINLSVDMNSRAARVVVAVAFGNQRAGKAWRLYSVLPVFFGVYSQYLRMSVDINRLMWAARRGMLELDLILMPFLERVYPSLSATDKKRFQQLLQEQDQDLFAWLLHRDNPSDPEILAIVEVIRERTGLKV